MERNVVTQNTIPIMAEVCKDDSFIITSYNSLPSSATVSSTTVAPKKRRRNKNNLLISSKQQHEKQLTLTRTKGQKGLQEVEEEEDDDDKPLLLTRMGGQKDKQQNLKLLQRPSRPSMESSRPSMESSRLSMESSRPSMESSRPSMNSSRPSMGGSRPSMGSTRGSQLLLDVNFDDSDDDDSNEDQGQPSVSFLPTVDVFDIPNLLDDLSTDELKNIWMEDADFDRIETDNFRTVKLYKKKKLKELHIRGLEYRINDNYAERRDKSKKSVWNCILDSQQKNWEKNGHPRTAGRRSLVDGEGVLPPSSRGKSVITLSRKYKEVTAGSALLAQIAGLKDEKEAQVVHQEYFLQKQLATASKNGKKKPNNKKACLQNGRKKSDGAKKSKSASCSALVYDPTPLTSLNKNLSNCPSENSSIATTSTDPSTSTEPDSPIPSNNGDDNNGCSRSVSQHRRPARFRLVRQPSCQALLVDDKKTTRSTSPRKTVVFFDPDIQIIGEAQTLNADKSSVLWYRKKEIKTMKASRKLAVKMAVEHRREAKFGNGVTTTKRTTTNNEEEEEIAAAQSTNETETVITNEMFELDDKYLTRGFEKIIEEALGRKDIATATVRAVVEKQEKQRKRRLRHKGEGNQFCHVDIEPEELARFYRSCSQVAIDEAIEKAEQDEDFILREDQEMWKQMVAQRIEQQ